MDTPTTLLIVQGLTGALMLIVGWVVKEIRNDGKETLKQVAQLNGRLGRLEEWKEIHGKEDDRSHSTLDRLWDIVQRLGNKVN